MSIRVTVVAPQQRSDTDPRPLAHRTAGRRPAAGDLAGHIELVPVLTDLAGEQLAHTSQEDRS